MLPLERGRWFAHSFNCTPAFVNIRLADALSFVLSLRDANLMFIRIGAYMNVDIDIMHVSFQMRAKLYACNFATTPSTFSYSFRRSDLIPYKNSTAYNGVYSASVSVSEMYLC